MATRGTTKFNSNKQEKRVAKEVGGKTVIASGSLWGSKGDVRADDYLIECKTTEKPYYVLSFDTWLKIEREAIKDGLRLPVMCIDTCNGKHRLAILSHIPSEDELKVVECSKSHRVSHKEAPFVLKFSGRGMGKTKMLKVTLWESFLESLTSND